MGPEISCAHHHPLTGAATTLVLPAGPEYMNVVEALPGGPVAALTQTVKGRTGQGPTARVAAIVGGHR
jgi:hypothetical protein